jgi:prepilin-type N-terminal cleavage/methylation domain-containing protein
MKLMKYKTQSGFTLIELLVVISIIGLMGSVVITTTGLVRQKGRDAKREIGVHQLQVAVELYRGQYGVSPGATVVFTSNVVFCTDLTPYVADPCNSFKDPKIGSYAFMTVVDGSYYVGTRYESSSHQAPAFMNWIGGSGEPAGLFYLYGPYK